MVENTRTSDRARFSGTLATQMCGLASALPESVWTEPRLSLLTAFELGWILARVKESLKDWAH